MVTQRNQLITTFRTKWGTYACQKIQFCLINARATFKGELDIAFHSLINKLVVAYFNVVTIFSKNKEYHLQHLKHNFERCRKYGILLNFKRNISIHQREAYPIPTNLAMPILDF